MLVTFANHHFGDFARNWVAHVRALGLGNYLVGAMDDRLLQVSHMGPGAVGLRCKVSEILVGCSHGRSPAPGLPLDEHLP